MEDIFTAINRQLKYDIFYSDDELDVARKIKLTDSKMEVSKLLKEVLQDDYSYEFLPRAGRLPLSGLVRRLAINSDETRFIGTLRQ